MLFSRFHLRPVSILRFAWRFKSLSISLYTAPTECSEYMFVSLQILWRPTYCLYASESAENKTSLSMNGTSVKQISIFFAAGLLLCHNMNQLTFLQFDIFTSDCFNAIWIANVLKFDKIFGCSQLLQKDFCSHREFEICTSLNLNQNWNCALAVSYEKVNHRLLCISKTHQKLFIFDMMVKCFCKGTRK